MVAGTTVHPRTPLTPLAADVAIVSALVGVMVGGALGVRLIVVGLVEPRVAHVALLVPRVVVAIGWAVIVPVLRIHLPPVADRHRPRRIVGREVVGSRV